MPHVLEGPPPELDDAFGSLWGRAFEDVWHACGSPASFSVVEIGGGEGSFARAVLASLEPDFRSAVDYVLVERTEEVERRQREVLAGHERVTWVAALEDVDVGNGCLFANEVLDNLPVHLVEGRGGDVVEIYVGEHHGSLIELEGPATTSALRTYLERARIEPHEGQRVEVAVALSGFVSATARVLERGALFFVDYGVASDQLERFPAGTLVCYSKGGIDDRPLEAPGTKDITAHVNWTALAGACVDAGLHPHGPFPQRRVLQTLGVSDIDDNLRADYADALAEGRGAAALRALSRRHALAALAEPGGLGGLEAVIALKDMSPPAFLNALR